MINPMTIGAICHSAGTVATVGQPPTNFANCIVWLGSLPSTLYTASATGGGVAVSADADPIGFVVSQAASDRCGYVGVSGSRPLYKTSIVNSNPVMRFDGSDDILTFNLRSGLDPTTADLAGDLLGLNSFTYVCALSVLTASTTSGATYPNHGVFNDVGGYVGLHIYNIDSTTCYLQAYVYPTTVNTTVNKATFLVAGVKHDGTDLKIRINGGSWASAACGNIGSSGSVRLGGGGLAAFANVDITDFCTFTAILSDADLLEVERYFGARIGVTI